MAKQKVYVQKIVTEIVSRASNPIVSHIITYIIASIIASVATADAVFSRYQPIVGELHALEEFKDEAAQNEATQNQNITYANLKLDILLQYANIPNPHKTLTN